MSQRVDQRSPTDVNLDAYNKVLNLTKVTFHICKTKDKNINNHHVSKKNIPIANIAIQTVINMGSFILEANSIYVGFNANTESKINNYRKRINLQESALGLTFQLEHIIRALHDDSPFANSTLTDWIGNLVETRKSINAWLKSDKRELNKIIG